LIGKNLAEVNCCLDQSIFIIVCDEINAMFEEFVVSETAALMHDIHRLKASSPNTLFLLIAARVLRLLQNILIFRQDARQTEDDWLFLIGNREPL
jgi:hypothetical protein